MLKWSNCVIDSGRLLFLAMQRKTNHSPNPSENGSPWETPFVQFLLATLDEWVFILDEKGVIRRANPAPLAQLAYETLTGIPLADLCAPEARRLLPSLPLAAETAVSRLRLRTQEGKTIPVRLSLRPLPGGVTDGYLATAQVLPEEEEDAMQRALANSMAQTRRLTLRLQEAEQALWRSEQKFRLLVDHAKDAILLTDANGRVVAWNQAQADLTGIPRREALGRPIWSLHFHSFSVVTDKRAQQTRIKAATEDLLRTGQGPFAEGLQEIALETGEGKRIVQISGFAVPADEGYLLGSISRDVTAERDAAAALRRSEEKFRSIVEQSHDGIRLIDEDGRIVEWNQALAQITGLEREEVMGRPFLDVHWQATPDENKTPQTRARMAQVMRFILEKKELPASFKQGQNYTLQRPDGVRRVVQTTYFPIHLEEEWFMGAIIRDVTEFEEMMRAWSESEAQFRLLAENAQDLIYRIRFRPEQRFEYVSPSATRIIGYTPEEHYANPYLGYELIHPEDRPRLEQLQEAGGEFPNPLLLRWRHRDGRTVWLEQVNTPLVDEAGEIVAVEGVARDVTKRIQDQKALQARERFLTLLNDVTKAALRPQSSAALFQSFADQLADLLRAQDCCILLQEEPGSSRLILYRRQNRPPSSPLACAGFPLVHRMLAQDNPTFMTNTSIAADSAIDLDGACCNETILGVPLIADGRKLGALIFGFADPRSFSRQEIAWSEQAARQVALAIAKAELVEGLEAQVAARTAEITAERDKTAAILHSAADAIAMLDPEMRILYVNPAFTRLTGYPADEADGNRIHELIALPKEVQPSPALRQKLQRGERWQKEVVIQRRDGRFYDALLTVVPTLDENGRLQGYVASHHDITKFKQLAQARQQFISNVSHELRTPVTNLNLYLYLLRRQPDKLERYLPTLSDETERLKALVLDILEITELDSGADLRQEQVDLDRVLRDAVEKFPAAAEAPALRVQTHANSLPPVHGDEERLVQALRELVENGVTFTPAAGTVTLAAASQEKDGRKWATVTVRDTGPGLTPAEEERALDRFYRGDKAATGHVPGSGLGLSIAAEIVHLHGGHITAGNAPGGGAVFTLWLPAAE